MQDVRRPIHSIISILSKYDQRIKQVRHYLEDALVHVFTFIKKSPRPFRRLCKQYLLLISQKIQHRQSIHHETTLLHHILNTLNKLMSYTSYMWIGTVTYRVLNRILFHNQYRGVTVFVNSFTLVLTCIELVKFSLSLHDLHELSNDFSQLANQLN